MPKTPASRPTPPTDVYDALTMEVERADSLAGHLSQRLSALHEEDADAPRELYALSLVADSVSGSLQIILDKATALRADCAKTEKRGAR